MRLEIEELDKTMSVVKLNGDPVFMVYYDPSDNYTSLTAYDSDKVNDLKIITDNVFKTMRETRVNPRMVKKC